MAYVKGSAARAALIAATNCVRPAYLRHVGRASLDWEFENAARRLKRVPVGSLITNFNELRIPIGRYEWGETPVVDLVALESIRARHTQNRPRPSCRA
jgi:hypothetical protein